MTDAFHVVTRGRAACALVAVAAVWCGNGAPAADDPVPSRDAAIARVEQLGGKVRIDGEQADQPVWAVDFSGCTLKVDDLRVLTAFPALEVLNLADVPLGDDALELVAACRRLKELDLSGTKITDAGLERLAGMKALTQLELNRTAIGDEGLMRLAELKNLAPPSVFESRVTDAGLQRWQAARDAAPGEPTREHSPPDDAMPALPTGGLHALARTMLIAAPGDRAAQLRAAELLEQALDTSPDDDAVRVDLADAYVMIGEELTLATAVDLYENALARSPDDDRLLARLARTYADLENAEDAYRYAERRLHAASEPRRAFDAGVQIAGIALATGETKRAVELLNALAAKHPQFDGLRLVQAVVLVETDRAAAERVLQPLREKYPPPHPYGVEAERLLKARENAQ